MTREPFSSGPERAMDRYFQRFERVTAGQSYVERKRNPRAILMDLGMRMTVWLASIALVLTCALVAIVAGSVFGLGPSGQVIVVVVFVTLVVLPGAMVLLARAYMRDRTRLGATVGKAE